MPPRVVMGDCAAHVVRLEHLEESVERHETRVTALEHWRTFLLGCWLVVSGIGLFGMSLATNTVTSEIKALRESLRPMPAPSPRAFYQIPGPGDHK